MASVSHQCILSPLLLSDKMQGIGNFVNGCVILIVMSFYNLTGPTLDPIASRNTIMIQFAVGAAVSVFLVLWRFFKLKESKVGIHCALSVMKTTAFVPSATLLSTAISVDSPVVTLTSCTAIIPEACLNSGCTLSAACTALSEVHTCRTTLDRHIVQSPFFANQVWQQERQDFQELDKVSDAPAMHVAASNKAVKQAKRGLIMNAAKHFWPRLVATSLAWVANDFAFYGEFALRVSAVRVC